ncbi:tyrosine-type recombinase/integrase [Kitasatospora indigofera]|uniref:tyrosine-type recombinase/integrase n=1 Tax=Kitasatospora indigofera TaxID=67307 RepID=UPI0036649B9A
MELFFVDRRLVSSLDRVPGIEPAAVQALLERRPIRDGTAILLDGAMRPVEPISTWLEWLGARTKASTSKAYAQIVFRLMDFLAGREVDLLSASERDLLEYRQWRCEDSAEPISGATWDKEAAGINSFYTWAVDRGRLPRRPWRSSGSRRDTFYTGINRDMKIRHLALEQYLYFRDVGLGGLKPDGSVDYGFRGWCPQRNRTGVELALMTGMRLQEWSTVLLPELGVGTVRAGELAEFDLAACAKFGRPRTVSVAPTVRSMVDTYVHMEREHIVEAAQRGLRARRESLFVVAEVDLDRGRVRGRLDGREVVRRICDMEPWLRRITVAEAGGRLEPLALFIGPGGLMLSASAWDRIRWRAWDRMTAHAGAEAPLLPAHPWRYHDLRHTFALRLLIFLTRREAGAGDGERVSMATLLEHMVYNPILRVQAALGHRSPATTYRYLAYLRDPMAEVAEAFRDWSAADGASYAQIAERMMARGRADDAAQG